MKQSRLPAGSPLAEAMAQAEADASEETTKHTKLFWHSNAPWVGSGYGTQTALFVPQISKLGYDCAFSAFYGLKGNRLAWPSPVTGEVFPVYPGGQDLHANDVLGAHMKHWFGAAGGIGILLTDPWVISAKIAARLPLLAWVPLDHSPMIPRTRKWFQESGALPVAMSRFGEKQLRESGFESVYYVPHGFNPAVFRPVDRSAARRMFGIPEDAFVVGMVAANLGNRKAFEEAIDAFGRFRKTHTDAVLYLHTKIEDPKGVHLPTLCHANGVKPIVADQYGLELGTPEGMVAILMSAFDVLLNPSRGEGFGLTTLEAQACGTPCIVTNFSASPEVAPASAGNWNVDGQRSWTGFDSYQVTPDVEEIVAALEEAYTEGAADRQARRESVFHHANNHYQFEGITEQYWKPVLRDATIEIQLRDQLLDRH